MIFECTVAWIKEKLWDDVKNWIEKSIRAKTNDKESILLGNQDKLIANLIILITEHTIYKDKWVEERPTLKSLS